MKFRSAFAAGAIIASVTGCNCGVVGIQNAGGKLVVIPQAPFGVAATKTPPLTPASIAFGATPVGSVSEETVWVQNDGIGAVTVKSIALEVANDDVAITQILTGSCTGTPRTPSTDMKIMGNTCATFVVRYGPHAQTTLNGTIDLVSDETGDTTIKIPITGSGVGGSIQVCLLDPTSGMVEQSSCYPTAAMPPTVAFGAVTVGNMSVLKVRIINTGKYGLTITGAYISSTVADFSLIGGATVNTLIAPGMSYDAAIQFDPMANAMETASFIIPSNDTVNPSVTVPITGTAQGPQLCIMPNPLAFGAVTTGTTSVKTIDLYNCGFADYSFTQLDLVNGSPLTVFTIPSTNAATLTDGNSGTAMVLTALPTLPLDFPPGSHLVISIQYAPTVASSTADSAYLSVKTTYERTTVPITGNGGFAGCSSSGANLSPTAAIAVENPAPTVVDPTVVTFDPLTNVTLNASGSIAPSGGGSISAYNWSIVSQPAGSVASIIGSGAVVTLFMEIVGDYVVQLTVTTSDMCQSPPVQVTLHVISHAAIHIQLTWPQAYGDFDLHYSEPGGTLYETCPFEGDLFYIYSQASACGTAMPVSRGSGGATVEWAANPSNGTTGNQDPTQDVDQLFGYGPENDTQVAPFDGTYTVRVVFYAWDSCSGSTGPYNPATAVVNIFANGVLIWHGSQANMSPCDVWDSATITVANNGSTITAASLNNAIYQTDQCGE